LIERLAIEARFLSSSIIVFYGAMNAKNILEDIQHLTYPGDIHAVAVFCQYD
jgi:hypothetical protein